MRKDKLIELLQNIDGNPDILLWNGFVEDWMDITLSEPSILYKSSKEFALKIFEFENPNATQDEINKFLTNFKTKWELRNPNFSNDDVKTFYDKTTKNVVFIDGKRRGEKDQQRGIGSLEY